MTNLDRIAAAYDFHPGLTAFLIEASEGAFVPAPGEIDRTLAEYDVCEEAQRKVRAALASDAEIQKHFGHWGAVHIICGVRIADDTDVRRA